MDWQSNKDKRQITHWLFSWHFYWLKSNRLIDWWTMWMECINVSTGISSLNDNDNEHWKTYLLRPPHSDECKKWLVVTRGKLYSNFVHFGYLCIQDFFSQDSLWICTLDIISQSYIKIVELWSVLHLFTQRNR